MDDSGAENFWIYPNRNRLQFLGLSTEICHRPHQSTFSFEITTQQSAEATHWWFLRRTKSWDKKFHHVTIGREKTTITTRSLFCQQGFFTTCKIHRSIYEKYASLFAAYASNSALIILESTIDEWLDTDHIFHLWQCRGIENRKSVFLGTMLLFQWAVSSPRPRSFSNKSFRLASPRHDSNAIRGVRSVTFCFRRWVVDFRTLVGSECSLRKSVMDDHEVQEQALRDAHRQ